MRASRAYAAQVARAVADLNAVADQTHATGPRWEGVVRALAVWADARRAREGGSNE